MEKETFTGTAPSPGKMKREIDRNPSASADRKNALLQVSPQFEILVEDLQRFLSQMKQKLDSEECRIRSEMDEEHRLLLEAESLHHAEGPLTENLDRFILRMDKMVKDFTPQEHRIHRDYFQRQLHPFLLLSPFVKRAYSKPLGYPGDYEMMRMLYEDHDQGETLFGRLINRYCCQLSPSRSVMGRVPHMLKKINRILGRASGNRETVSVMSIGSGPAKEIQELIRSNRKSDRCHLTMIDTEWEALQYCRSKIDVLKGVTQSRIQIDYLNKSIHQLIHHLHTFDLLAGQDLIYVIGLVDYLPFHIAKHLIQKLYRLLSEEGELVIGNLDVSNDARYFMEYGAEWYVLYRTPQELVQMVEGISPPLQAFVETDEEGTQLYLTIRKGKKPSENPSYSPEVATVFYGKR